MLLSRVVNSLATALGVPVSDSAADGSLVRSDRVASTEQDGATIVIEFQRGQYFRLNRTATELWGQLGQPISIASLRLWFLQRYADAAPEAVLKNDFEGVIRDLRTSGLIRATSSPLVHRSSGFLRQVLADTPLAAVPGVFFCLKELWKVCGCLRWSSVEAVLAHTHSIPVTRSPLLVRTAELAAMHRQVAYAVALSPFRIMCLARSVVLVRLLRRLGHNATVRLGVVCFPFLAHAWAEVDGEPVNELPDALLRYRTL